MKFFTRKRSIIGLIAVVAVAAMAFGAYAYWTQSGSGTGTAATGTTTDVTVNQTSAVSNLYPGGPPVGLSGNFDNPNAGAVKVGSVTASVVNTTNAGCTAADFAIEGTAPVNAEIASGTNVGAWSGLTIRMIDSASNQDLCKNVTVNLHYDVSAAA